MFSGDGFAGLRFAAAMTAGRLAAMASRLARRGAGSTIRGRVVLTIDPGALARLLARPRTVIVSGTNGKTTTTHFLAAAARAELGPGDRLVHNAEGANLHSGITAALSTHPDADLAVLEADERVVSELIRLGSPDVVTLLNLSRDQLDRNQQITALARSWRDALTAAGPNGPVVVANANDPLVVWAAEPARQTVWVDTAMSWIHDSALCPACGALLDFGTGDVDGWHCRNCPLIKPQPDYRVIDRRIVDPQGTSWNADLQMPGRFNISNAACAVAAANLLGISTQQALDGISAITAPAGRFGTARFGDTTARLSLAKNPAGWAEALPLVQSSTVILAIDATVADGQDVSWLWDVDYEQLAGRTVIASGPRAQDLAVRLRYADIDYRCVPDLDAAVAGHTDPFDVISTYTSFQRLSKMGGQA